METKVYTNSALNAEFVYDDADDYQNEIAELYSYSEDNDFQQNFGDFQIEVKSLQLQLSALEWRNWENEMKYNFVMKIVDQLDNSNDELRMRATRCILYLAQGCWAEVKSVEEQQELTRANIKLLYKMGIFQSMISLLNMEQEKISHVEKAVGETDEFPVNMHDSVGLRLVINVLYTIVETIRYEQLKENSNYGEIIEECINEISNPLADGVLLPIKLLNMITKFCDGSGAHFPIKKLLLLLWKSSLLILGSTKSLQRLKNSLRAKFGLLPMENDTLNASKLMQASIVTSEETAIPRRPTNPVRRNRGLWEAICENVDVSKKSADVSNKLKKSCWSNNNEEPTDSPVEAEHITRDITQSAHNSLFFEPKVRLKDIEIFLQNARQKYFGYILNEDNETLVGLPLPVQESVQALRRHLYVSLSEKQIELEQHQCKHRLRQEFTEATSAELLYQGLLPNFRKYITDLLRILLASSPSAKLNSGSLSSRVLSEMLPTNPSAFSTSLHTDIIRHKEIIVKAVSAVLLLYLKHFKINHIYQFEYMSQLIAQSSFIKLALQVFAPIISEYVTLKSTVPKCEFPICVIRQSQEDYTNEHIYNSSAVRELKYTWRTLFSSINLLRILNKIVKWKNSRVLNMVSLKSTGALKDVLKIRQPLLQIYVLKLLKMQARYLGRYWRRNNLKVMTAIYTKVRHRFNDDWAYGCDTVAKFWNAQEEEFELRMCVMRFHARCYPNSKIDCELSSISPSPPDGSGRSNRASKENESYNYSEQTKRVTSGSIENFRDYRNNFLLHSNTDDEEQCEDAELSDYFKENYEVWLNHQVFSQNFDWDSI